MRDSPLMRYLREMIESAIVAEHAVGNDAIHLVDGHNGAHLITWVEVAGDMSYLLAFTTLSIDVPTPVGLPFSRS